MIALADLSQCKCRSLLGLLLTSFHCAFGQNRIYMLFLKGMVILEMLLPFVLLLVYVIHLPLSAVDEYKLIVPYPI